MCPALPVKFPIPLTVALPSSSSAATTHEYWPASEALSVPNDTLTVEEEPADRFVNVTLFLTVLVGSLTTTMSLVTLTQTVTVKVMVKPVDPITLLPETEKLMEIPVKRIH